MSLITNSRTRVRYPAPPVRITRSVALQLTPAEQQAHDRARVDPEWFVDQFVCIYDATSRTWLRLHPWPAQQLVLVTIAGARHVILLKARQIGMTWLVLAFALWMLLF